MTKCSVPCPNGNECPAGELCFDNTPCDSFIPSTQPFYCGLGFAEAADKCWQPCPSRQDSECCFGQTWCVYINEKDALKVLSIFFYLIEVTFQFRKKIFDSMSSMLTCGFFVLSSFCFPWYQFWYWWILSHFGRYLCQQSLLWHWQMWCLLQMWNPLPIWARLRVPNESVLLWWYPVCLKRDATILWFCILWSQRHRCRK